MNLFSERPLVLLVEDDRVRAHRAGYDALLIKPCERDDLIRTLKALITEARGRRSA